MHIPKNESIMQKRIMLYIAFATKLVYLISSIGYRRDVPVGVPLDLSTPTGMSCIGTYGENCKSDNVSKYHVL